MGTSHAPGERVKLSPCGRFIVLEDLHIDREVLAALTEWSERRGLRVQDGIQLAILAFTESVLQDTESTPVATRQRAPRQRWPG